MNFFSKHSHQAGFKIALFFYMLFCGSQPIAAAPFSASASIDWSSFTITPIDIGNGLPTLTWNSQNDSSQASASNCYYCSGGTYDYAADWVTGTLATETASTTTANRSASASTSTDQITSNVSSNGAFANAYYNSSINSYSNRSGSFSVQGSGLFLFKANYSLSLNADENNSGNAGSGVSFNLSSYIDGASGSASQNFSRNIYTGLPPITETGILAVALAFNDGWTGNFSAQSNASLSSNGGYIPIPAAFWLFSSALAGIAVLRNTPARKLA